MPLNCKSVLIEDVIKLFDEDIDGMGKNNGYPRNEGVPASLRQAKTWKFCELTEDGFTGLEIPDGTGTLIKDTAKLEGLTKSNVLERVEILKSGKNLLPLIARTRLTGDAKGSSFYIEDGAKRAISFKVYFENDHYKPVRAYIGIR